MLASYTLVDNATLTAVQRVLGQIPLKSRDSVDGDLCALEHLVTAILFYEDILCLDDYKPEWQRNRVTSFPFVQFKTPDALGLANVPTLATAAAANFRPEIRSGKFVDPIFGELLERLHLNMRCTWDISSSVYYLTLKMLGKPDTEEFAKYSKLCSTIYGELSDISSTQGAYRRDVALFDSSGNRIDTGYRIPNARWGNGEGKTGGPTKGLQAFIASLNWMSYKTIYYSLCGRALGADLTLHPIRHQLLLKFLDHSGAYDVDFARAVLDRLSNRGAQTVEQLRGAHRATGVSFKLPFFSAWIVEKTGDVRSVLDTALELRSDRRVRTARDNLSQVRLALDTEGLKSASIRVQRIYRDVESSLHALAKAFGIRTTDTPSRGAGVNDVVAVYNAGAPLAGWPSVPNAPEWLARQLPALHWPPRGFAQLLRDVSRDLSELPQLGSIRDQLGAAVRVDRNTYDGTGCKALDPKYERATSEFKSPM